VSEPDREFCTLAVASLKRALSLDGEPSTILSHRDSPVLTDLNNGLSWLPTWWTKKKASSTSNTSTLRPPELIDDLWNEELAHFAPNGVIAAVPCRDILAFCDAENASGVLELRQLIQRVENGDHPISSVLYRRHASIWKPYAD
jgi:hypothetical protein